MADRAVDTVTRTVTISDLSPAEMASIFAAYSDDQQAAFFDAIAAESKDWPGTGWSMQALYIVSKCTPAARRIIATLADYLED